MIFLFFTIFLSHILGKISVEVMRLLWNPIYFLVKFTFITPGWRWHIYLGLHQIWTWSEKPRNKFRRLFCWKLLGFWLSAVNLDWVKGGIKAIVFFPNRVEIKPLPNYEGMLFLLLGCASEVLFCSCIIFMVQQNSPTVEI